MLRYREAEVLALMGCALESKETDKNQAGREAKQCPRGLGAV